MEKIDELKGLLAEIVDLQYAIGVLGWDQQTYMPVGGSEDRGDVKATLSSILHARVTSPRVGQLLEDLRPYEASLDPDSDDARLLKLCRHEYLKRTKIHPEWVGEYARATTVSQGAWQLARQQNAFAHFQPYLERVVTLKRDYASFFAPYDHIYDPLLDDFERGMKTAEVQAIFAAVRPVQVKLIQAITARPQVDDSFLYQEYAEQTQWDFGVEVITRFGYDWNHGRQDRSAHPFTSGLGFGDVRITTRFEPKRLATALFGTMHEAGHALYDQGFDRKHRRTPLANGASMAIHESQSRMWENLVGRSLPFWQHFYPRFQSLFPSQIGEVPLEVFYRAINKVAPSYIRVEADEATYNLHIMLRLELEIALMENQLAVRDLPEAWNQKMEEYLGIRPPTDRLGVLQDIHWSEGYIGYFPTYALGNLVSAQLWEKIQADIPTLTRQIQRGEFGDLLAWLRSNVHRQGAKFQPQELVQRVTGSRIDPQPYLRYLQTKYSEIYHL